jgi:hypothetical protein
MQQFTRRTQYLLAAADRMQDSRWTNRKETISPWPQRRLAPYLLFDPTGNDLSRIGTQFRRP